MKLPKNYFENLSAARYREYLKLLPGIKKENTRLITMLIFTFIAMSVFGLFAINPTLATITDLKRQLADSKQLHAQLTTKINNLSNLQGQYNSLAPDLPYAFAAIPNSPTVPLLLGQIQTLIKKSQLTIMAMQVNEVQLAGASKHPAAGSSFVFIVQASGTYEAITGFLNMVTQFNRLITLEQVTLAAAQADSSHLIVNIRARAYFE